MKPSYRVMLSIACFLCVYLLLFLILLVAFPGSMMVFGTPIALIAAIWIARKVWLSLEDGMPDSSFAWMVLGAAAVGMAGFLIGFIGPMIFAPGANQGPLLGIFYTGPLGVLLGAFGGLILGLRNRDAS